MQLNLATDTMRVQADQVAKAMQEQSRAIQDMTRSTQTISKRIQAIAMSNLTHSTAVGQMQQFILELKELTTRTGQGVQSAQASLGRQFAVLRTMGR